MLARGCIPVALELMDQASVRVVEDFAHAGYPVDAGAVLLVEFEGLEHEVEAGAAIAASEGRRFGAEPRIAETDEERARLWKGRKSIAGAIARAAPDYYLHDTVVPRTRLAGVLDQVLRIGEEEGVTIVNVAHAGDGNLHPLILFDGKEPGVLERVFRAGTRIVEVTVEAGGVLSGEHGIGLEKRDFLYSPAVMAPEELDIHTRLRAALEPTGFANPGKKIVARPAGDIVPTPSLVPEGTWL
jgi:glycolate oxidase